ncbi:MAG: hypothetical protein ACTHKB_11500 [Burkholderiaceae bacterium]
MKVNDLQAAKFLAAFERELRADRDSLHAAKVALNEVFAESGQWAVVFNHPTGERIMISDVLPKDQVEEMVKRRNADCLRPYKGRYQAARVFIDA